MPVFEDEIPLINGEECSNVIEPEVVTVDWDKFEDKHEYLEEDDDYISVESGDLDGGRGDMQRHDDAEEARKKLDPDDEGLYHDDPLWWGKSLADIRQCTEDAKACGNEAHSEGDTKSANRHWKNALKGAQKLRDYDVDFRLRLNLAMGYTKLGKTNKALDQCDEAIRNQRDGDCNMPPALFAKAHYRRAEALEAAGEVDKALASVKAALQVEPGNVEARRKHGELKKLELEHRKREKALFAGKSLLEAVSDDRSNRVEVAETDSEEEGEETEEEEEEDMAGAREREELKALDIDVSSLTNRAEADKLVSRINNGSAIDYVGDPMSFYGPVVTETGYPLGGGR